MSQEKDLNYEEYYFSSQDYDAFINGVIDLKKSQSSKTTIQKARKTLRDLLCKNFYSPSEQRKIFSLIRKWIINVFHETSDIAKLRREKWWYFPENVYQVFENYVQYSQNLEKLSPEELESYYTNKDLLETQCYDLLEKYVKDPEDLETLGEMLSKGDLSHIWKMGKLKKITKSHESWNSEPVLLINKSLYDLIQEILKKCEEKLVMDQISPDESQLIQKQINSMISTIKKELKKKWISDTEISTFLVSLFQGKYEISDDSEMSEES